MKRYSYIILAFVLWGCAQTKPLVGGEKDIYAPTIDSAKTYPLSGQTNFDGDEIRIKFNEYIKLNNPTENILIIPQMDTLPTIEAKNKRLTIHFNQDLQPNTTYTITFNGAIRDITENNDSVFQYVFSTGNYIDSLELNGNVSDAFTNKAESGMLVGLYPKSLEADFDSIPLKFKPTYLAQTDKSGNFRMNYLKAGIYYLFAIGDINKNLKYDQTERFAFLGEKEFKLSPDDTLTFQLKSFLQTSGEVEISDVRFTYPGRVEIILTNPTDSLNFTANMPLLQEDTDSKDSLVFWFDQSPLSKTRFYIDLNGELDTLKPVYEGIPDKESEFKLKVVNNVNKGKLLPAENLRLVFSEPIGAFDRSAIHLYDSDSNEVSIASMTAYIRTLEIQTAGTTAHRLVIDSAAVNTVFGRVNEEVLTLLFENEEADYYGSLILTIDTTFSEPVLIHLLDEKGEVVETASFAQKVTFEKLIPGNYQLRLVFDVDGNGEWTTGSLAELRVPENVIYNNETVNVKSKWEKEIDWKFKKE